MKDFSKEIMHSLSHLQKGNILLYPTDTVWGLGCDATDDKAVEKIYRIKNRKDSKSLIILVDSIDMLTNIIPSIPEKALEIIENSTRPTSIIYDSPQNLASNVIAHDDTVAIRVVQDVFCQQLIREFGKPIVSTSANISGESTPKSYREIATEIKQNADYIVALHQDKFNEKSSRIIKITGQNEIHILRK